MSQIDLEISALQLRLASLEEQKQKEAEKKTIPLKILGDIVDNKRKQIQRNSYSKSIKLARFYDEEKLAFLEPIFNMLKDIQERLQILENK